MPQVDLSSVCAGAGLTTASQNDNKITCETLADDDPKAPTYFPSDFPPESFVLSKEAEEDWIDQNVFIERRNSGRSSSLHSVNLNPATVSGSQRYSLTAKTKPSFLGLPKPQKAAYADAKHRKPVTIRLFPKRSTSSSSINSRGGKSAVPASEPSSPKVSCIGRVRSRRDRSRRKQNRRTQAVEPAIKRSRSIKSHKTGFWTNFRSIFSSKSHKTAKSSDSAPETETIKKCKSVRKRDLSGLSSSSGGGGGGSSFCTEPPNLGAVKRFSSGRRSDSWASDMEVDGAKSEPLNRGSIWSRRNKGVPPKEISVNRKGSVGPVSV